MAASRERWDVIIVGGGLAGASAACLLLRERPDRRILILERTERHGRKVGESTVEISAYFLGRELGLTEHLLEKHLPKQGMRFWAMNEETETLDACSEIGPGYNVRLPSYQVDRAVLDEHVLGLAVAAGAVARRGVRVRQIRLQPGGAQTVFWQEGEEDRESEARWLIDASGVAALLSRQEGWFRPNAEHPTTACWGRWTGVTSWDDRAVAARYPAWARRCPAVRTVATNHLTGYGWWAWWIPLRGGEVSIGVVFDQRLCALPPGPTLGARLRAMLESHPAGRELLRGAQLCDDDLHYRANLAYTSDRMATDGAVLVGDAAAFLDPFYSPGIDWISMTVSAAVGMVAASDRGEDLPARVERHNRDFTCAYDRWFRALYKDKYYYLGDHELMSTAFRIDLGMYYLGGVRLLFRTGAAALPVPLFGRRFAEGPAALMALYNRRLAALARKRQRRGRWGRRNAHCYFAFTNYEFNRRLLPRVLAALVGWLWLEAREALNPG